jgi:hypothetical protein
MPATIDTELPTEISEQQLLKAVEDVDWEGHWRTIIDIMTDESTAYEEARAKSLEGAAQRVFL